MMQERSHDNFVYQLHPLIKLVVVALTALLVVLGPGFEGGLSVFSLWLGLLLLLWFLARIDLVQASRPITLGLIVSGALIITQGFLYRYGQSYTPIFTLADIQVAGRTVGTFTLEGLVVGVIGSLKILCVITSAMLLALTSDVDDLSYALMKLQIPRDMSFVLLTGMRFVPLVQQTWNDLLDAQRLRGHDIDELGIITRIRYLYPRVLGSLILILFRLGLSLEITVRTRGFGATKRPTEYFVKPLKPTDYVFAAGLLAVFVVVAFELI